VVKPAPPTVAIVLGSVRITTWSVPAEVMERVLPREAPVIGTDDLLDLILDLRRGDPRRDARAARAAEPIDEVDQTPSIEQSAPGAAGTTGAPGCEPGAMTPSPGEAESRPARPNAA
jgi:hypothetical protein